MHLTLPKLLSYLDGTLPADERAVVEETVRRDPQAQALLQRARRMPASAPARGANGSGGTTTGTSRGTGPQLAELDPDDDDPSGSDLPPTRRDRFGSDAWGESPADEPEAEPALDTAEDDAAGLRRWGIACGGTLAAGLLAWFVWNPIEEGLFPKVEPLVAKSPALDPGRPVVVLESPAPDKVPVPLPPPVAMAVGSNELPPTAIAYPGNGMPTDPQENGMRVVPGAVVNDPQTRPVSLRTPHGPTETLLEVHEPAAAGPRPILGTVASGRYPLLRYVAGENTWRLVEPESPLRAQDMISAPPHSSPTLTLGDGLLVEMHPGTSLEILETAADSPQRGMFIHFGRVRVTARKPGVRLQGAVAGGHWLLVFEHAGAAAAITVESIRPWGRDVRREPAVRMVHVDAVHDASQLVADGRELPLAPGERLSRTSLNETWEAAPADPTVTARLQPQSSSDEVRALALLSEDLARGTAPELSLPRFVQDARPVVRVTAARWLAHLGEFNALTALLDDPGLTLLQRDQLLDELESGLARGPGWTERVDDALQQQYGSLGTEVLRLLIGVADADRPRECRDVWVPALDHERLAVRVAAFRQVRQHFGVGLHYRPDLPAVSRRPLVQRFRERADREVSGPESRS